MNKEIGTLMEQHLSFESTRAKGGRYRTVGFSLFAYTQIERYSRTIIESDLSNILKFFLYYLSNYEKSIIFVPDKPTGNETYNINSRMFAGSGHCEWPTEVGRCESYKSYNCV